MLTSFSSALSPGRPARGVPTPPSADISTSEFNTDRHAIGDRFDAWREYLGVKAWRAEPKADSADDQQARAVVRRIGSVVFSDVSYGPQRIERLEPRAGAEDRPFLTLKITVSGQMHGLFDDQPYRVGADQIEVFDLNKRKSLVTSRIRQLGVFVPYEDIGFTPGVHEIPNSIALSTLQGQMLKNALFSVFDEFDHALAPSEAGGVSQAIIGLISGVLIGGGAPVDGAAAEVERARDVALRTYVEENLDDLELDAAALCNQFNVSRATLYRAFAEVGGLARFATDKRLDRAFVELAAAPRARGAVRNVAERWGYFDPAHFNKAFKARFGIAPSEILGLRRH